MKKIDLCGAWQAACIFSETEKNFDFVGHVPGSAINDLIGACKLPQDIFWRDHADAVLEFEKRNRRYGK